MNRAADVRRRAALAAALALVAVGVGRGAHAADAPAAVPAAAAGYATGPASADGIGKRYMGREIAAVMGWQGSAWLERAEREQEERTDLLVAELALGPGMRVADIGAGTGYFTRRLARAIGPTGVVFAVDVQPEMIEQLARLAVQEGRGATLKPVLGAIDDVRLAPASIELALLVDVYHELEFPREVMQSVVRALRPGGRVVLVEYRAEDPRVPIKRLHTMSVAQIRREMAVLPLLLERVVEPLPWQHIVVLRKRS
ncbi:MAG: methyltransferase domain-containing protein [Caldimonas sp.]